MCKPSFSNLSFLKFSHNATYYSLDGKTVNVMLESVEKVVSGQNCMTTCVHVACNNTVELQWLEHL